MQKILPFSRIAEAAPYMDAKVLHYINEGQIEAFESFPDFSVLSFDWYDVKQSEAECPQILIYLDREDVFFFCETARAEERAGAVLTSLTGAGEEQSNGQMLYRFFARLIKDDTAYLDGLEAQITDAEDEVLAGGQRGYLGKITEFRRELLRLKRYYEQLDSIFDELAVNDNGLFSEEFVRRFTILGGRTGRYLRNVGNLREYVTQMREAYQSQIDIQQNELMKIFTVVTVIFLPLTLLVGWYGMNFKMPELNWPYSYPLVAAASVVIAVWLIVYFKKKKWF